MDMKLLPIVRRQPDKKEMKNYIQGVQQYCIHFCFLNFLSSWGSRKSILDIFNSTFRVEFRNIHFFYYLVKNGMRYCQNTTGTGRPFLKLTFFV